jgi:uncharacterized damage-inducible protein DinB
MENNLIKTSMRNWTEQNKRLLSLVESLTEEQLENEIASGKNTGKYLVGHLAAINYNLLPLFGLGENPQPELNTIFVMKPDKAVVHKYSVGDLRDTLVASVKIFDEKSKKLTEVDWLGRHFNISEEEFSNQPHRNKINVLINRTLHLAYHMGQLALLKENQ